MTRRQREPRTLTTSAVEALMECEGIYDYAYNQGVRPIAYASALAGACRSKDCRSRAVSGTESDDRMRLVSVSWS